MIQALIISGWKNDIDLSCYRLKSLGWNFITLRPRNTLHFLTNFNKSDSIALLITKWIISCLKCFSTTLMPVDTISHFKFIKSYSTPKGRFEYLIFLFLVFFQNNHRYVIGHLRSDLRDRFSVCFRTAVRLHVIVRAVQKPLGILRGNE